MGYLDSSGLTKQVQYIKAYVNDRIDTSVNELGTAAYENTSSFAPANHEHNHVTSADTATTANSLVSANAIDGVNFNGSTAIIHYGTCATAAGTVAKVVSCTSYTLVTGSRIIVKFTKTNTAANPTLNVNSSGAKAIQYRGAAITAGVLAANRTYEFIYDGTNYQLVGDLSQDPTIKQDAITGVTVNRYGSCSTAAATAAKTVSVTAGTVSLETGLRVTVKFANANTANSPTLNVNSKGAKNIFHKGVQITNGANKALLAGICDFVYDGTQFHLVGNYIDTDTTYTAGTGLSLSNTTLNHSNSITAGTAGTSSATSGSTLAVPYVTYDAQGHITATGTHTHTISGFLTSSSTLDATKLSGTIPTACYTDTKVNVTLGATTKAYLLGTSTTPTSTATGVTAIGDTNVYLTTTSGQLHVASLDTAGNVVVGGTADTNYLQLPSGIKLY